MAETAAEAAYRAARRRIQRAKRAGEEALDLSGLPFFRTLDRIPPEVAEIVGLQTIRISDTAVSDLAPLAALDELQNLDLTRTDVFDVTPLAGLKGLVTLRLEGTRVSDLTGLADLTALQTLVLNQTEVYDIGPLAGLNSLRDLHLNQTNVTDLSPLADFSALRWLYLNQTPIGDVAPLAELTELSNLALRGSNVADLRPLLRLRHLGTDSPFGLMFGNTPATRLDFELARLAEIKGGQDRARQTLAYLNTLPPWPEPYTPKARPDGLPPEPIGGAVEPSPPTVQTAEAQIRALLRNALVTRISAAAFAEQIAVALRGVPATNGNELAPALQLMAEVGEVLGAIGRQSADAQHEENLLRLRISQLESLVDRLTVQLKDAEEARKAAEALAQKDGFMRSYRKSLGIAAGAGTVTLVGVGVPTAAVYFLGAEHELVKAFLTVLGHSPKA